MKVSNNITNAAQHGAETAAAKKAREASESRSGDSKSPAGDGSSIKADISARAREFASAKKAAMEAPEVREAKIAELKRRIANKEYNVKPDDIADRMVNEHMRSSGLA